MRSEYTIYKSTGPYIMQVIVRHEKHHTLGTLKAAASHTMRTRPTANSNPAGPAPEVWVGSSDPAHDVASVLPDKRRKNAVLSLEYLVTASPEFFQEQPPKVWREYLRDQLQMLKSYYGEKNVVSAVLHLDERTPHLSVQVVPLVDGKLNARALIGTRDACRIIQDLAGEVGKPYGVLRGKPRSTAKHQDVRHWYEDLVPRIAAAQKIIARADKLEELELLVKTRARALLDAEKNLAFEKQRLADLAASLTPIEEDRAANILAQKSRKEPVKPQSTSALPEPSQVLKNPTRNGFKPR